LQHAQVSIAAQSASGTPLTHSLDLGGMEAKDLDGELLDKLGLHLFQPIAVPIIGDVTADSVAQRAGLQTGDRVLRANGVAMQHVMEFVEVIRAHPAQAIQFDIQTMNPGKRLGR
jgi:regulator of sigma E protease